MSLRLDSWAQSNPSLCSSSSKTSVQLCFGRQRHNQVRRAWGSGLHNQFVCLPSSGRSASRLYAKACEQFQAVHQDTATLALWGDALSRQAQLCAVLPAEATRIHALAVGKFKAALELAPSDYQALKLH